MPIKYDFIEADSAIPSGKHQVRMEFKYDGGGLAKGGDVTLYYDGSDVGDDSGSPASTDYGATGNAFTGEIDWVQLDVGDDDHNHLITPEQRFNLAMAKQ